VNRLRQLRLDAGITCTELARRSGVKRTTISMYEHERREPTVGNAIRLARALGETVETVFREYAKEEE
jgi:DNA-binding XRE family transcriptional regulator